MVARLDVDVAIQIRFLVPGPANRTAASQIQLLREGAEDRLAALLLRSY